MGVSCYYRVRELVWCAGVAVCGCLLVVSVCLLVVCSHLLVVCGCLLVVCGCLLVVCGCLLVVCGRLWLFTGGLWLFAGGLWSLPVLVTTVGNIFNDTRSPPMMGADGREKFWNSALLECWKMHFPSEHFLLLFKLVNSQINWTVLLVHHWQYSHCQLDKSWQFFKVYVIHFFTIP